MVTLLAQYFIGDINRLSVRDAKGVKDASLLYFGDSDVSYNVSDIWIQSVELIIPERFPSSVEESNCVVFHHLHIDSSVKLNYSNYCRDICREKALLIDEESCRNLAWVNYINNAYQHSPDAEDDNVTQSIAKYWHAIQKDA